MRTINIEDAAKHLENKSIIFIDTRTPSEFEEAHIPGAINIPLFTDDERALIGTIYHKESKEKAMEIGVKIFGERLNEYLEEYSKYKNKTLIIYCWRGGMRSKAITSFLDSLGYNVMQLEGGHKAFRNYIIDKLKNYEFKPRLIIIYGPTGSNKTKLINDLYPHIDLEGLAQHRSSLFGAVGLTPRKQKMFESLLFIELEKLKHEKFVFIEGESRKIGDTIIPEFLFKAMKNSIKVRGVWSLERRAKNIVEEYFDNDEKIRQISEVIKHLTKFIGHKKVEELLKLMEKKEYYQVASILLRDYYDIKYGHTINSMEYELEVETEDLAQAKKKIMDFAKNIISH